MGGEAPHAVAAAIETPQPAGLPATQDEGADIQGEDQRAQKLEMLGGGSEAGAAQADNGNADPRNSSRPAEEVASAPPPADRTLESEQPAIAVPPGDAADSPAAQAIPTQPAPQGAASSRTPKPPPAGHTTAQEKVLRLWANTDLDRHQIAERSGCSPNSVHTFVSIARRNGDERARARDPKPTLIAKDDENGPPKQGFAKPVEVKAFEKPKSSPLDPRPGRIAGVVIDKPGTVVSLDMSSFIIACPGGDWQTSRPVALIMERMRNGETFDDQTLADIGSMGLESFRTSINGWTEKLAERGIEFVRTKGVGCKVRVAGT